MSDLEKPAGVSHERTDVDPGPVARFGFILLAASALVGWGVVYLVRGLRDREVRSDPTPAPMAQLRPPPVPPEPRLQTLPFADIETLRAEESQILASYGWVDKKAGVVRIPVDQAMEILLKRGLPVAEDAGHGVPRPAPAATAAPAAAKKEAH